MWKWEEDTFGKEVSGILCPPLPHSWPTLKEKSEMAGTGGLASPSLAYPVYPAYLPGPGETREVLREGVICSSGL